MADPGYQDSRVHVATTLVVRDDNVKCSEAYPKVVDGTTRVVYVAGDPRFVESTEDLQVVSCKCFAFVFVNPEAIAVDLGTSVANGMSS